MDNDELMEYPAGQFPDAGPDLGPRRMLRRQLLGRLIVGQTIGVSLLAVMTLVGGVLVPDSGLITVVPLGVIGLVVGLVAYWLLRREHELLAAFVFLLGTVAAITSLVYIRGYQDASGLYYLWPILAAALLLETRGAIVVTAICALVYSVLVALQLGGYQTPPLPYDPQEEALLTVGSRLIIFFLLAFLGWLSSRNLGKAVIQAHEAVRRWRGLNITLEERIAERTRDLERRARYLEATAAIAQDTAMIMDLDQLLTQIVERISKQFGFYHTGIFLLDLNREWAVLQAASSPGGQRMLARGHRLKVGQEGIVGYVTERGQPRVALDVGEDAVYFDNPDLPETRSELTLPLQFRGELIGVLDVQSREPGAFGDEDVAVLQTLADQVAVAIENARLFLQVQDSLEAERRVYGELGGEAWAEVFRAQPNLGFVRNRRGIQPSGDLWRPEMERAVRAGKVALGDDEVGTLAIPIKVGDQIVGVVDVRRQEGATEWSREEIELLETLSEQLGMALESARLYQETQRREFRERLVGEISGRFRGTLDVDKILQTAAQDIRQALGLSKMTVQLAVEGEDKDGEGR